MHIAPYDNRNRPIVDTDDARVPLVYFNIVRLRAGEHFDYRVRRLQRVRIMHVHLGTLPVGKWRELTTAELRGLLPAERRTLSLRT